MSYVTSSNNLYRRSMMIGKLLLCLSVVVVFLPLACIYRAMLVVVSEGVGALASILALTSRAVEIWQKPDKEEDKDSEDAYIKADDEA